MYFLQRGGGVKQKYCRWRFKCFQKVKDDDQQRILRQYWSFGYGGQRDFIGDIKKETKAYRKQSDQEGNPLINMLLKVMMKGNRRAMHFS